MNKYRLDIGITKGLLSSGQMQEIKASHGQNTLFYQITKGEDIFRSENVSNSLKAPVWNEIFTYTLESEVEIF